MGNVNNNLQLERINEVKRALDALYEEAMKLKSIYFSQPSNIENRDRLGVVCGEFLKIILDEYQNHHMAYPDYIVKGQELSGIGTDIAAKVKFEAKVAAHAKKIAEKEKKKQERIAKKALKKQK